MVEVAVPRRSPAPFFILATHADVLANGLTAAEQNLVVCLERYAPDFVARMRAGAAEPEVIGFGEPDDR
jgi:hypothetical protein